MGNLNLRRAEYCLEVMKRDGIYRAEKIGKVIRGFPTLGRGYEEGDFVLFSIEEGESTITVETPLTRQEIEERRSKNSLISTFGTIINVPRKFVEELNK